MTGEFAGDVGISGGIRVIGDIHGIDNLIIWC